MKRIISAISIAILASSALADTPTESTTGPKLYVGASMGSLKLKEDDFNTYEPDFPYLMFLAGAHFNQYLDGEIRIGKGLIEDSTTAFGGATIETELDYIAGAYLKLGAGEKLHPYIMAGYSKAELTLTASNGVNSASVSEGESDVAYGLGLDIRLTDRAAFNIECASYYDKDDTSLVGCGIGLALAI